MDHRTALSPKTKLRFNADTIFTIRGEVGRGGTCIVYDSFYLTNAGDQKTVRIKECYPFDSDLHRDKSNQLLCSPENVEHFNEMKSQMYQDFMICNKLFYADYISDAIINTLNIYEANNTVYSVSLWSRENSLPNTGIANLRECVSIVRQTAAAIESIHNAGYFYLDIKPDNISIINTTTKRVQLFDFDNLLPISAVKNPASLGRYRLSYTKGFAALELRRGQLYDLGPYTDVYGIGALLFYLLFGRTPEAPDCTRNAKFNFSHMRYQGNYPDRLYSHIDNFLHKSLSGFFQDRYQTMAEAVHELEIIEKLSDPAYFFLISSSFGTPDWLIGRENEIEIFDRWCRDHSNQIVFISGMGGIGKSTFVRHYIGQHRRDWDSIVFLYFNNTIRQTIIDDEMLRINGTERLPEEKDYEYFHRKLQNLHEIIHRDRILLIIDNFDNIQDPDLDSILKLNCKTIILTRQELGSLNLPVLKLGPIPSKDKQIQLFSHYLNREISEEEIIYVQNIIQQLSGHTLALELFARQVSNSFLSLPEALDMLNSHGILHIGKERVDYQRDDRIFYEHLETIITQLFETNSLSPEQISILKALALFPSQGVNARELIELADIKNTEQLHLLNRYGWITQNGKNVSLHPLIHDVVKNIPLTHENSQKILKTLNTLRRKIISESKIEELNIDPTVLSPELKEMVCRTDLYEIITDQRTLQSILSAARTVIDGLVFDPFWGTETVQKLIHAIVTNLPRFEDDMILHYGNMLLENPRHLTPLEVIQTVEVVEMVLLEHQEFDKAIRLIKYAEQYAQDDRTKAEFYELLGDLYDTRDAAGDREKTIETLNIIIVYARKAASPPRKHLLAENLLGKMNAIVRRGLGSIDEFDALFHEICRIIDAECLPYSHIRHGFAITMGFYYAEVQKDPAQAEKWIEAARFVAKRRFPIGLDYIDYMIIPPAIIYIDLQDYEKCESTLMEGISICEIYPDIPAYLRKKHDLHRYLLDVYLEENDPNKARGMINVLDEETRNYDFPDTVLPEIRQYLA